MPYQLNYNPLLFFTLFVLSPNWSLYELTIWIRNQRSANLIVKNVQKGANIKTIAKRAFYQQKNLCVEKYRFKLYPVHIFFVGFCIESVWLWGTIICTRAKDGWHAYENLARDHTRIVLSQHALSKYTLFKIHDNNSQIDNNAKVVIRNFTTQSVQASLELFRLHLNDV